ncbi:N(6)-L-threonylcarbamoyladenine synthase [Aphelenchoides bicaudatus]|nr:N(6)-L-threonylcarbamoyladenine synthase [Aphelenchoides bicaudatus]
MRRFCSAFSRSFCAKRSLTVLAIETSADDCCAAIVNSSKNVLSHKRVSFDESQRKLRGILPSLSGQLHRSNIDRLVDECIDEAGIRFDDLDAIGATVKPGLVLCLKVGADKSLGTLQEYNRNFIPIHHMRAHALVSRLVFDDVEFPFLCLLISGGHSILCVVKSAEHFEILGQAISMSPGEAIDKVARSAGIIPKIHYGSEVEEYAKSSSEFLRYVDRMPHVKGTDFDFTTIRHFFEHTLRNKKDINLNDFCANLQFIVAGHLCQKLVIAFQYLESAGAFESNQRKSLVVSGGVAANSVIRSSVEKIATHYGYNTRIPPKDLVVDNAIMCAWTAIEMILAGTNDYFPSDKLPSSVYVEAKSPIGTDLREEVIAFQPEHKLRLLSMNPNVKTPDVQIDLFVNKLFVVGIVGITLSTIEHIIIAHYLRSFYSVCQLMLAQQALHDKYLKNFEFQLRSSEKASIKFRS